MSHPVTTDTFAERVLESPLPVLVDFWASRCPPCRMLQPIIDQLSHDFAHRVRVVSVNIDEQPGLADAYQVAAVPTLLLMVKGAEVGRSVGFKPAQAIRTFALQDVVQP